MLSSKQSNGKMPWALLSIEGFLVVLSVLLALALNSWREGRANEALALRSVQSVMDEADVNCFRIKSFQEYHRSVADREHDPEGIQVGLIRNDAWNSAQSTGAAAYVDYDIAAIIGKVHASQADHRTIMEAHMQAMFTTLAGGRELEGIHGDADIATIRELVRIQEQLLEVYEELAETVNEKYGDEIETSGFCSREEA